MLHITDKARPQLYRHLESFMLRYNVTFILNRRLNVLLLLIHLARFSSESSSRVSVKRVRAVISARVGPRDLVPAVQICLFSSLTV
jgi:hypothetical protein